MEIKKLIDNIIRQINSFSAHNFKELTSQQLKLLRESKRALERVLEA